MGSLESWEPGLENGMRHHDGICAGSCQSNYIPGPNGEVGLPVLIREFYTGDSFRNRTSVFGFVPVQAPV